MSHVKNYRSLNNLFEDFFNGQVAPVQTGKPLVNIFENAEAYLLEVVAPGLDKEALKVNLENGTLTISYEKPNTETESTGKVHRREFALQSFKRSFQVEDLVNLDAVQAKYDQGILRVSLPKKEDVKVTPKQITID
jgi:HSP20 family protein